MAGDQEKTTAANAIEVKKVEFQAIARFLWENPELCHSEHLAHEKLTELLASLNFQVQRNFVLPTAFKAVYEKGSNGPHVAIICEYDALPGIGHACGHNLIAMAAVAAAYGVMKAMDKHNLSGKVTVLGTPAEEGGGGKLPIISDGFFNDVDAAMMVHPHAINALHLPHLAAIGERIVYTGVASHAAGSPWEGVNALDAGVTAYQAISCLRQQIRPTWRIHGIIKDGGTAVNVIPDRCELHYFLRAPTLTEIESLQQKVRNCFHGSAQATGCDVSIETLMPLYANLRPNRVLLELFAKNASHLGVVFDEQQVACGSTDMGNVSQVCPSIQPMFHIGTNAANHTIDFTQASGSPLSHNFTIVQAKAMAATVIDLFLQPEFIVEAKKEFLR